ncbi:MAG: hypothetical protein KCHDKBKB_00266 [Elusimicrobia bacterium]|nr:hypothetical protein [Elusimicrobiota bacterium]
MAVPIIVPHAGIAAMLIFVLHAPHYPGMLRLVLVSVAIMMILDFLTMYFIDQILMIPALTLVLTVLGSVLIFMQACLATQMILVGLGLLKPVNF